ncbi:hypothetical protein I4F81_006040 [Pyropia yezoensis]|uniref:Uncharacterized protein n=1 Tax=Pyropia yezoensis TaxID=2788 RepID=A0ACC3C049_PYRYE|nr:hypothetical protein I4F81_006040 [Neopyropia yezoensis]
MTTPYAHSADGGALKTTLHLAHLAAAAAYTTVMAIDCAAAIKTGGGWPLYFLAVGTVGTSMASSLVFAVVKGAVVTLGWAELPTVTVAALWWSIGFVGGGLSAGWSIITLIGLVAPPAAALPLLPTGGVATPSPYLRLSSPPPTSASASPPPSSP